MLLRNSALFLCSSVSLVSATSWPLRRHYGQEIPHLPSMSRDDSSTCILPDPADTITDRLNIALNSSGPGFVLQLCQNANYLIQEPIAFAAPNQEISTVGYPTGDERATLVVSGAVFNGNGHTTAVDGTCSNCNGVILRNVQINGTRLGAMPTNGGANIEMGGPNTGQLVEYVRSYDPRSWSCLHIAEGSLNCNNVTVRNNDIGPCGSDAYQQWADGISVSCRASVVTNNTVVGPTDGGIVLFGSPGSLVENNTIQAMNHTLLGGINMVDIEPWGGDYSGTIVRNNIINGGFADPQSVEGPKGNNDEDVILKIGIAIGPRTWFGDYYGSNVSSSGTVLNNVLSGAFGYGIAMTSARNFTVQGNVLFGNTSFIGARGPNCTETEQLPSSGPFVVAPANVTNSNIQSDFQNVTDGDGLTCVQPPDGGDYWPYAPSPSSHSEPTSHPVESGSSGGAKAGVAIGIIGAVFASAVLAWFIRKRALQTKNRRRY